MKLKTPPLVEVWLSFGFDPGPNAPVWDRRHYKKFLKTISSTHPKIEGVIRHGIRVEKKKKGKKNSQPQVIDIEESVLAMRALSEDDCRSVQLEPDRLTIAYIQGKETEYPGFSVLVSEAMTYFEEYLSCYRPNGAKEVTLHYDNIIEISRSDSEHFETKDFFSLNVEIPHAQFGHFVSFDLRAVVRPPNKDGVVEFVFATQPGQKDDTNFRFRLEWHTSVQSESIMDDQQVRDNLQIAHDRIETCFRSAFTERGWALFDPD